MDRASASQPQPLSFTAVKWGPDDAKGDDGLTDYFVETRDYTRIVSGEKRYIIGRKGTGKTAILEKIRLDAKGSPHIYASELSLRSFPINSLAELGETKGLGKANFVAIWQFLLCCSFAAAALRKPNLKPTFVRQRLQTFMTDNFPVSGFGFASAVEVLRERGGSVHVGTEVLSGEISSSSSSSKSVSTDFYRGSEYLKSLLRRLDSDVRIFVLMDELDEGYKAGDKTLNDVLLGLLRAVEEFSLSMRGLDHARYNPVLALRSDIFDNLEDNDLNKLDDYVVRLNWKGADTSEYSLRRIVNQRIWTAVADTPAYNPRLHGQTVDLWPLIARDTDANLPPKVDSLWKYLVNRTFERPRDLVKFLKVCGEELLVAQAGALNHHRVLTFKSTQQAEMRYSDWLYRELRDELQSHIPVWHDAMQAITTIGRGRFSTSEFITVLKRSRAINKWLEEMQLGPESIVSTLFDFSVLGNIEAGVWLFKYKDHDLPWNPYADLIVHYGLHGKLRLLRRD